MNGADAARPFFFGGLIAAALAMGAGLFGPHEASLLRMPGVLRGAVERALQGAGLGGLETRMEGQRAVLSGVVGEPSAIAQARRAALTAAGAGGPWAGGITSVDVSDVSVGRVERPYAWRAARRDGILVLSGAAPSERAKAALLEKARALFPDGDVIDEMRVAGGAPGGAWRRMAIDGLEQIARLDRGEARLTDARLVVLGSGSRAAVEAVRRHYDGLAPAPFSARADVTVTGEPLAIPELADLSLDEADAPMCAQAFERLLARNVINFATGSAELDRSSLMLLDNLASVSLRCDRFTIEIAGHTDNQGAREANLDLSRRRAETVMNYLASQNVARERLVAIGHGPDRPVASNATLAGQAANRRIVFSVRQ